MINQKKFYTAALFLTGSAYVWIIINLLQYGSQKISLSICALKNISGYPCVTCGSTRAVLLFFKGDFAAAFLMNPIGFAAALFLVIGPFWMAKDLWTKNFTLYAFCRKSTASLDNKWVLTTVVICLLALWYWNIQKGL